MGEEIRGTSTASGQKSLAHMNPPQEAQDRYRQSKAELDELVQNMEGL